MSGRRAGTVVVWVLALGLLAGCTSARSELGTSDSACFLALPTATRAVGPHSRLLGARLLTPTSLGHLAPSLAADLPPGEPSREQICVLAFAGSFTAETVAQAVGLPSGPVAVVVTRSPSNQLIGTVIVGRAPLHFGHSHIG
jgi:hypothetical protein